MLRVRANAVPDNNLLMHKNVDMGTQHLFVFFIFFSCSRRRGSRGPGMISNVPGTSEAPYGHTVI